MIGNTDALRFAAALLGFAVLIPAAHAQLYGASPYANQFYRLDMQSGVALSTLSVVVPARTITGINAVTIDPTSNIAYAVIQGSGPPGNPGRILITIDLDTAVGVEVGDLGDDFGSLAFRADGQLFGATSNDASVPTTLYRIDKTTASRTLAASLLNSLPFFSGYYSDAIAFNPRDSSALYHWTGNGTIRFEKLLSDTPTFYTTIPTIGATNGEIFGAVWDECDGVFLTSNIQSSFNTFTPTGNISPPFGSAPDDIRGLALVGPNSCNVDLAVSLSITPQQPTLAGAVAIHAQVANAGPARARVPTVTIALPASITAATTTGCLEDPAGIPTCSVPTLFLGETAAITIAGAYDGASGSQVTAQVTTTSIDTVAANNSATLGINDTIFAQSFE